MEIEKQQLILGAMADNRELLALCSGIIKPSYFDPSLKKTVKFMGDYFSKYLDAPKSHLVKAECGIDLPNTGKLAKAELQWIGDELEVFCRNRAMAEAIIKGPEHLQKNDYGAIMEDMKAAISIGLQRDLGIQYFENPLSRLKDTLVNQARISTGIAELDNMIGGGLSRQELILFTANSGGGKSMNMLNLAKNLLLQGYNGVYISLEMAEGVVTKRMDSMVTYVAQEHLLKEMTAVAAEIEKVGATAGKFYVKRMPENRTNINNIRSYIEQLRQANGFEPDFIVIDYLDIMSSTHNISLENLFVKDKYVTEEVRSLGFDFNCIMISASQLGRGAIEAEKLTQAHIQGGISKINTADYVIGIKQDDLMRAAGEIIYDCLKSRNSAGVGTRATLAWDPISLNIKSRIANAEKLILNKRDRKSLILGTGGTAFSKGDDALLNLSTQSQSE
jgi:archaellum biogenesis ATPase FlaH